MLKNKGGVMEALTKNDREVAEIIVLELINETKFNGYINRQLLEYFKENQSLHFKCLNKLILRAQSYHHHRNDHTYILKNQNMDIQYLTTMGIIEHYWEKHHESAFNRWNIPAEARHLFEDESKQDNKEEPSFSTKLPSVMEDYNGIASTATERLNRKIKNHTWVEKILGYLDKYKADSWAWNTLTKEFQAYILGSGGTSRWHLDAGQRAKVNIFVLFVYEHYFTKLYAKQMTKWDIPPQVRYLWEDEVFETNNQIHDSIMLPDKIQFDDQLDAWRYGIQQFNEKMARHAKNYGMGKQRFKELAKNYDLGKLEISPRIHKSQNPKGETTMKLTKIETITFIDNLRADEMGDDQIFALISQTEKDIDKLEAVKEKPKKLTAKITAMKESVKELGKIVDARD